MLKLNVNTKETSVDLAPDTPVLWALRDGLGLSGTKYGCGVAQCGAGNGNARRFPASARSGAYAVREGGRSEKEN